VHGVQRGRKVSYKESGSFKDKIQETELVTKLYKIKNLFEQINSCYVDGMASRDTILHKKWSTGSVFINRDRPTYATAWV
jgi:hypothetical protein